MINVTIICGGRSSEHEISCISASGIIAAIDRKKFNPSLIGITKSGKWVLPPLNYRLTIDGDKLPEISEDLPETNINELKVDLLFPVLHGPYGEDGTFQGLCEMYGKKYVGSGVLASAVAMDKSFAKPIFASHGIATAPGIVIKENEWQKDKSTLSTKIADLGYPVFVKPARGGSSRGTSKVKSDTELEQAMQAAFTFDSKVMVEVAIVGW